MRKLSWIAECVLLATSAGCADSHEQAAADMVASMREMNDVLDTVKDAESAEAAKPELQSIAKDLKAIQARTKTLGEPTEEQKKALKEEYGKAVAEQGSRLLKNMIRIQARPDVSKKLREVLRDAI